MLDERVNSDAMPAISVAHVTTVHVRTDTRIKVKECMTLLSTGAKVTLLVQDGKGFEHREGIAVVDLGSTPSNQLVRFFLGSLRTWRQVRDIRPEVVHFHDPELIPAGLAIKALGVRVIYDVHEDVPRHIMSKLWIPRWARKPVSLGMQVVESLAGRIFDGIVAATPRIANRFPPHKTVTVQNFPILSELDAANPVPMRERPAQAAYIGSITGIRGAKEMVAALESIPQRYGLRLALGGTCSPESLRRELAAMPGWASVDELGWIDRTTVGATLARSRMGLVTLHPVENYLDAYPVKMFEYMAASVPVVASDFPLWREIVEDAGCGLLVDPLDPRAIAGAVQWLFDHPEESEAMGRRGRQAVEQIYNWEVESRKLLGLYRRVLDGSKTGGVESV